MTKSTVTNEQSTHLGPDGKALPYILKITNSFTELNKLGLERLAYWSIGRKSAKNYILNQALAEYLAQHEESQWPIPPSEV